ncbi:redox-sensing transcriptional repressor [Pilibacter termitis]|uniref:Redox-sensing transcriptional repressor Rex n=1 Tax=Pilibacter termitis TaxID=263852 RepID=A0A1T4NM47_9ENTE|nr:redox-sensing transcriptional repressor Rex [Pilibacter termitis]SJZ80284.1 redox-sensing transcriptional repressor [Pilibacter termitis]
MKEKLDAIIPKATAKRLALYYRYLRTLHDKGIDKTNSKELSEALQVDSATIRRDFSYFGELGKRGYGYDVENLVNFFAKTLNDDQLTKVALVGVGNLGSALLKYKFHQNNNLRISVAFDSDKNLVGKKIGDIEIFPMNKIKEILEKEKLEIVILAVPSEVAQELAEELIEIGVKGFLNFTPHRIITPNDVVVQSVDLTNELQTLIYFLKKKKEEL